ncbi:hypothetical protein [Acrocarpospora sp. B8E8]|uniref:hypothetical protein n=1 Tax=Acrocarpospora sp. B8E8 TaxID=3153572 RepID=UPI00325F6228
MRKTLRLVLAAVTGAAVIGSGAAITAISPASASALRAPGAVSDLVIGGDRFIPPSGSDKITFSFNLDAPYATEASGNIAKGDVLHKVWARFTADHTPTTGSVVWETADVTALSKTTADPVPTTAVKINGSIPVKSTHKPSARWRVQLNVTSASASQPAEADSGWVTKDDFEVKQATRVTSANVDPDTVKLKSGADIDVFAAFKLERGGAAGDEKVTDVRLESKDSDDYYSLNTGLESDDSYHDSTSMDYDTETGSWQLKVSVTRGSKTYAFVKGFSVTKGAGKAKSKITLVASPSKVKKGKATKLYGKVYRGYTSWGAWKKKILKLYFKKKGTKTWKFVGYVGSNSSGKYSKTVKPKYDGYWRLGATASSLTNKAWSPAKFVDVR